MKNLIELKNLSSIYRQADPIVLQKSIDFTKDSIGELFEQNNSNIYANILIQSTNYARLAFQRIENSFSEKSSIYYLNLSLMYSQLGLEMLLDKYKTMLNSKIDQHNLKGYFSLYSALLYWSILLDEKNLSNKIYDQVNFILKQNFIPKDSLEYDLFSIWCYEKWTKTVVDHSVITGSFGDLINKWQFESDKLEPILNKICDLHCYEIIDSNKKKTQPKLIYPPYTLLPLEIHVINKLRMIEGLDEINLDHPLMKTNVSKIKEFSIIEDDLLERIQLSIW